MQNVKKLLACLLMSLGVFCHAQDKAIIQNYINHYKEIAIAEEQRTGVPASIKLAQGIHETMAGTSDLVVKSNNHFGIKCKDTWTGESVTHDDDARGECFRKYNSPADSYRDHSNFLKGSSRYASLFKLDPLNYSAWAYGLKKAGYATNPRYPQVIIKLIEDYNLQDYTLIALGKGDFKEETLAKINVEKNEVFLPEAPVKVVEDARPASFVTAKTTQYYPQGEFKINETRVVHEKSGTSFLAIARQYNIPLARLFEFNDLTESEVLAYDQLIYLQRKRKTGNNEFHVVKAGETLHDIAQEEAIRMESLLEYNQLQKNMKPAIGQQLALRTKAPVRPLLAKDKVIEERVAFGGNELATTSEASLRNPSGRELAYTVQPKETIYSISKKHNVKIDDLIEWNQLRSYDLKTGQQLKIYK